MPDGGGDVAVGQALAANSNLAGIDAVCTGDGAHQLGTAGTDQARKANNLAGAHRQRDVLEVARRGEVAHLQ